MKLQKIAACALCAAMLLSAAACSGAPGQNNGPAAESASVVTGGWEVNGGVLDVNKAENRDAKAAFEKATETLLGVEYTPLYLLGSQTVAGTNYCFAARAEVVAPEGGADYVLVYVYADLDGNAQVSAVRSLADELGVQEGVLGGWALNEDPTMAGNPEAEKALETAAEKNPGLRYEPLACLASQVVAGKNYCIACRTQAAADGADAPDASDAEISLVFVYADLAGDARITREVPLDLGALAEDA